MQYSGHSNQLNKSYSERIFSLCNINFDSAQMASDQITNYERKTGECHIVKKASVTWQIAQV